VAVGLHKLSLGLAPQRWANLQTWIWAVYAAMATICGIYAVTRARRDRVRVGPLARRLDREHRTADVLSTALALEDGTIPASKDLAAIVHARARACTADLGWPVRRFRAPSRSIVAVGVVAAAVALLPAPTAAVLDPAIGAADTQPPNERTDPALSRESLERLADTAELLARLEQRPGLTASTLEKLRAARERLDAVARDQSGSLSRLARVEQDVRELQIESREQRLHDPARLRALTNDDLAEAMSEAIRAGHHETAAALAEEMSRRVRDLDDRTLASMSRSLGREDDTQRATSDSSRGDAAHRGDAQRTDGGSAPVASEMSTDLRDEARWDDATAGLRKQMSAGDREAAHQALRAMAQEMADADGSGTASSMLDRSLDEIRRARAEQLARMNGAAEVGHDGNASRGSPADDDGASIDPRVADAPHPGDPGRPLGRPGGTPGPGGGSGAESPDDARELPLGDLHAAQRVDASPDGASHGSVAVIRRFAEGARDDREYEDLHHHYQSVAESAVRREQIPLTRRDYIRNYFQAVRPR
jgi:hypothetical protein